MSTALSMALSILLALVGLVPAETSAPPTAPPVAPAGAVALDDDDDDDDKLPVLWIDDVAVEESEGEATFTIVREGKTKENVEFSIATSGVDATEDVDYIGQATTLTIKKDKDLRRVKFTVPIIEDAVDENDETFIVTLSEPVGATLQKAEGLGTIIDNDRAGITVDEGDGLFVVEGEEAADSMTVVLHSEPTDTVFVTMGASPGQLEIEPMVVSFAPDDWYVPRQVEVRAASDGMDEPDPHLVPITFLVESTDPPYNDFAIAPVIATVGDEDALLVTIDGPSAGAIGIQTAFSAVVNAGGTGTITHEWTVFLDGNPIATGSEAVLEFTPAEEGLHIVRAVVGDQQGQNPAHFIELTVLGDVSDSTFVHDIVWLAQEGITRGCNADGTEFCPNDSVTRAQMAAFLVRFLGLTDDGGGNTFTDDDGSVFETDIAMLAAAGITNGCNPPENTRYCPSEFVTREQMAAFVVRALQLTDDGGGNTFVDDDGSIYEADIAKLAAAGITRGCNADGSHFCPKQAVNRGEMSAFLHRADEFKPGS